MRAARPSQAREGGRRAAGDRAGEVCYLRAMMKIDAEKFLALTVLLATTASAPACGKKDATPAKTEAKAAPAAPAAPAATAPAPVAPPPAAVPEPEVVPPPVDDKAAGGAAAKPDPGPEEEKPSW